MKFLDFEYDISRADVKEGFKNYKNYLQENENNFPKSAFKFAAAEWHYDTMDHRCPHDAWVESLSILEKHLPKTESGKGIKIELILLGAYHDGQLKITYENVRSYQLNLLSSGFEKSHHGDWIIDEVQLSENNFVIHEIKFWLNGNWQIECEDIKYEWLPFE
ncbi:MAG TPA: hypothetical protein PKY59_25805 [Pyrinomonadaceae bacterium]|nr:hypothetical protein [Pyrinomonadaceae bacterium]